MLVAPHKSQQVKIIPLPPEKGNPVCPIDLEVQPFLYSLLKDAAISSRSGR